MILTWERKDNKDFTVATDGKTLTEARAKIKLMLKTSGENIVNWVERSLTLCEKSITLQLNTTGGGLPQEEEETQE